MKYKYVFFIILFLLFIPINFNSVKNTNAINTLNVTLATYKGNVSSIDNYLVIEALITASGTPINGASVTFSDNYGSTFTPSVAATNTSGIALTTVQFTNSGKYGQDNLTATATYTGYNTGSGSNVVTILPPSNSQLSISASIQNTLATGASSDVISGNAFTCSTSCTNINGVDISINDTLGSVFPSTPITTNYQKGRFSITNGYYAINFTLAQPLEQEVDLITVTASSAGYANSSSTLPMIINPYTSSFLTVNMGKIYPSRTTSIGNSIVIITTITSHGIPIAGASISFTDSFDAFNPFVMVTNASGIALTTLNLTIDYGGTYGQDILTATATYTGYNTGSGSSIITILPISNADMSVGINIYSNRTTNSYIISGYVYTTSINNGGFSRSPVIGATISVMDSLKSACNGTAILTDSNGHFLVNCLLPTIQNSYDDIITITASKVQYLSSSSSVVFNDTISGSNNSNLLFASFSTLPSLLIGLILIVAIILAIGSIMYIKGYGILGRLNNKNQLKKAQSKGFPTLNDYVTARKRGFVSYNDYQMATQSGFEKAVDYTDAKQRGFTNATVYKLAMDGHFATYSDYLEASKGEFTSGEDLIKARTLGITTAKSLKEYEASQKFKPNIEYSKTNQTNTVNMSTAYSRTNQTNMQLRGLNKLIKPGIVFIVLGVVLIFFGYASYASAAAQQCYNSGYWYVPPFQGFGISGSGSSGYYSNTYNCPAYTQMQFASNTISVGVIIFVLAIFFIGMVLAFSKQPIFLLESEYQKYQKKLNATISTILGIFLLVLGLVFIFTNGIGEWGNFIVIVLASFLLSAGITNVTSQRYYRCHTCGRLIMNSRKTVKFLKEHPNTPKKDIHFYCKKCVKSGRSKQAGTFQSVPDD